ncbi:hypothetical protein LTS18_000725, partial [Coniosporium uncinatum]
MNDKNEVAAIRLVQENLPDVPVPRVYFASQLGGTSVLIQERLPGVTLDVADRYLPVEEMRKLREHMNIIINRRLHTIRSPSARPSTVVPRACGSWMLERDCSVRDGESLGLIHGDLSYNNVIVKDGKIV